MIIERGKKMPKYVLKIVNGKCVKYRPVKKYSRIRLEQDEYMANVGEILDMALRYLESHKQWKFMELLSKHFNI